MNIKPQKLIIIDGHNFLWRSYSVPFKFHSQKGTPLHVVTTYLKLLRRSVTAISKFSEGDFLVVVFDSNTSNSNRELSADYKATRKVFSESEESPFKHLPHIKKALDFLKIKYLELPNIEADDVVATLVTKFANTDSENRSFIVSTDSDFYQLLDKNVSIVKLKSLDQNEIFTPRHLKQLFNIHPHQYVEFKSLTGDTADNISGIKGIGSITAEKIVNKKMDFDHAAHEAVLDLNRKLITLNREVKIRNKIDSFKYNQKLEKLTNKEVFLGCNF